MQRLTGTYDVFGEYSDQFRDIEKFLYEQAEINNFKYIKTPIIESTNLFHREVNNTIDQIDKHTYNFYDLSGKSITLRPECNSGLSRAVIENGLYNDLPKKFFYYGDVFRYDKPQKGRYREFTQFGFENIGVSSEYSDVEMMSLAYFIYNKLGINDVELRINSLGNIEDINKYRVELINYFSKYINSMCAFCQSRINNNPLRILNCQDINDKDIIENAPKLIESLSKESLKRIENVLNLMQKLKIPYIVDDKFIRGIDYQNDTIFEIFSTDKSLGNQNSLCSGGRYDNLYRHLYNKQIPAFGFDFGLERLIMVLLSQNNGFFKKNEIEYFIINLGDNSDYCFILANKLRQLGIKVEHALDKNSLQSQFNYADRFNSKYTIFIGDDEINHDIINIRENITKEKISYTTSEFLNLVKSKKEESEGVTHDGQKIKKWR